MPESDVRTEHLAVASGGWFAVNIQPQGDIIYGRVGDTEQEHSHSKANVKHDREWSPNEWVTVMRSALRLP